MPILEPGVLPPHLPLNMDKVIKKNQKIWAQHELKPEQCDMGYTTKYEHNFFTPISPVSYDELSKKYEDELPKKYEDEFSEKNKGREFTENKKGTKYPSICALHSSTALVVNAFEYWRKKNDYCKIAVALKIDPYNIKSMHYEGMNDDCEHKIIFKKDKDKDNKDRIISWGPDVHFEYSDGKIVAIECKFNERFGYLNFLNPIHIKYELPRDKFKKTCQEEQKKYRKYWKEFEELWLPNCNFLNKDKLFEIRKDDEFYFKYLDVPQLCRHILGLELLCLSHEIRDRKSYQLIYLYYPVLDKLYPLISEKQKDYDNEIKTFKELLDDDINFTTLTWYDFFNGIPRDLEYSYLEYNLKRYLTQYKQ